MFDSSLFRYLWSKSPKESPKKLFHWPLLLKKVSISLLWNSWKWLVFSEWDFQKIDQCVKKEMNSTVKNLPLDCSSRYKGGERHQFFSRVSRVWITQWSEIIFEVAFIFLFVCVSRQISLSLIILRQLYENTNFIHKLFWHKKDFFFIKYIWPAYFGIMCDSFLKS